MNHLKNIGNRIPITIKADEDGFIGRECPVEQCEGYFKVTPGTGLQGENLPCHCPYCGHIGGHGTFWTKEQIEYAQSIAVRKITDAVFKDLKSMEFESKPRGGFGIEFSLKVKPGRPVPIRYYREKQLETTVVCEHCCLKYAIYGVFAYCPDCGVHNSKQILHKNLELSAKEIDLSNQADDEMKNFLLNAALENVVSAFDGFGREIIRVRAHLSSNEDEAIKIRFQNLESARRNILRLFGIDIYNSISSKQWEFLINEFNKRHLFAHKMGVIDEDYKRNTNDTEAVVGHKVTINPEEIVTLITLIKSLSNYMFEKLPNDR